MALIGNRSVLHKSPNRFLNGNSGTGGGIAAMRSAFNLHGMMRNVYEVYDDKSAIPYGHLSPSSWVLPKVAGGISSRNVTVLDISSTGLAYGGITTTATASFTIVPLPVTAFPLNDSSVIRTASASFSVNFNNATGKLITNGIGSASLQFTFANALLTASIGGEGTAALSVNTNNPLLGAISDGNGSTVIQISIANAQVYPLNDSSPARTGTVGINFAGSLTPYATGSMTGTTVDSSVITSDSIADAVWNAVATDYNNPNSTGNKLNTASTGGVDLTALVNAILEDVRFKKVLTKGTFLALK
jgi:hypothetical protein